MPVIKNNGPNTRELCNGSKSNYVSITVMPGHTAPVTDAQLQVLRAHPIIKSLFANGVFSVVPEAEKVEAPAPKSEAAPKPVGDKPKGRNKKKEF